MLKNYLLYRQRYVSMIFLDINPLRAANPKALSFVEQMWLSKYPFYSLIQNCSLFWVKRPDRVNARSLPRWHIQKKAELNCMSQKGKTNDLCALKTQHHRASHWASLCTRQAGYIYEAQHLRLTSYYATHSPLQSTQAHQKLSSVMSHLDMEYKVKTLSSLCVFKKVWNRSHSQTIQCKWHSVWIKSFIHHEWSCSFFTHKN